MTTAQIVLAIIAAAIGGLNLGFVAGLVYADTKPLHLIDERQDWSGDYRS